jgi:hypothetical protein
MGVPHNHDLVAASFTRPADTTAYASGDLIANSTTAGSVVPLGFANASLSPIAPSRVRRAKIVTSNVSTTNASFRLHLFCASPTVANGDNGAISFNQALKYLGSVDITVGQAATDGAAGQATTDMLYRSDSNNKIYGLLEARAAYTPTSAEVFTVVLEVEQD